MKTRAIVLLYCMILLSQYLYGGNIIIADNKLKTPIPSATVLVWVGNSGTPLKLMSDNVGIVEMPGNANRVIVRKFGYEERKITDYIFSEGDTIYGYGISLVRNFLLNKLRVSLSAENFAPTYYSRTYTTQGDGFYQTRKSRRFHAYYSLSISFSFGNLRARVKETETSISNTDIKNSYDE